MPAVADQIEVGVFTEGLAEGTYARLGLEPFAQGIAATGDACRVHRGLAYQPCDVAVIFGEVRDAPAKRQRMRLKAEVVGRHIHRGLVVIDTPVLMRSTPDGERFRRLGLDGIHRDAGTFPSIPNGVRWALLRARYGIESTAHRQRGSHVHVLLQRTQDASLRGSQRRRPARYLAWLHDILCEIRAHTDRQIIVRPHPGSRTDPTEWRAIHDFAAAQELHCVSFDFGNQPLREMLANAWATVTFNSGSAIDSLLAGVPAVTTDPGSFAWPVAAHSVAGIEDITLIDLKPWLHELAYVDWSLEELASGAAWRHLRPAVQTVV